MIDSADNLRFDEAKLVLHDLLNSFSLNNTPFLILGNKSDLSTAIPLDQLISILEIPRNQLGSGASLERPMQIFSCSLIEGTGYTEAFKWLSNVL